MAISRRRLMGWLTPARWPLALTALLAVTALARLSPLADAVTAAEVPGAILHAPAAYLALAPLCTILDALTALSIVQHLAFLGGMLLLHAVWRIVRRAKCPGWRWECAGVGTVIALLVAVYLGGLLLPRPMTSLQVTDPNAIVVDFHSHTNASWDGRPGFNAEANREWHRAVGFNAAYVTDHASVKGANAGLASNPARAGDGTVLLQGLEARALGDHIIALDVDPTTDVHPKGDWTDPTEASLDYRAAPLLILTIPGSLASVPGLRRANAPLVAFEIADGSPKGIGQAQRDAVRMLDIAAEDGLALVSGSDNHGWSRAAVGWTILRIPGWRAMTPARLDTAIVRTLRTERQHASSVIIRRAPSWTVNPLPLIVMPLRVAALLARTLSWPERFAWIAWVWIIWGTMALQRVRRARRNEILESDDEIAQSLAA